MLRSLDHIEIDEIEVCEFLLNYLSKLNYFVEIELFLEIKLFVKIELFVEI